MDIDEIAGMLNSRAASLAAELLPRGSRQGHEWVEANTASGGLGDSLKMCVSGAKSGIWSHWAAGRKGDALDLVAYIRFADNKKEAVAWAKSWLGLDNLDPGRLQERRKEVAADARRREAEGRKAVQKKQKMARNIWMAAQPVTGTPVVDYLAGRGIDISDLAKAPGALRFAPECRAYENGQVTQHPAMLAAIVDCEGRHIATHRTYLQFMPDGRVVKAGLEDPKKVLAPYRGGVIPLSRGASGKSLKDAPDGDRLILCEGIEDGLSLALCCPDYRVHAAVSIGNFQNITLPPAIRTITIAADNDGDNEAAEKGLNAAIERFYDEGRQVFVARSPVGKDFNDFLQGDTPLVVKEAN